MVRGFIVHSVVFAVVNALLVVVWLETSGSDKVLDAARSDPLAAFRAGMWPVAVIAAWGGLLVIHAAIAITSVPRRVGRKVHHAHRHPPAIVEPPAPIAPGATARDLGRQVAKATVGLVESLAANASQPRKPPSGRQLVTVMFTDLVSSTDLAEQLGDTVWHGLLVDHRRLVRECLEQHDGAEVGTQGDGFLMRFVSPDAAVACAVAIQRGMGVSRDSGAFTPELRVGVHAGEAMADDNDLVGRIVNLASRVASAAEPSEILVTEPVADHLSPGMNLLDRGLVSLKGIAQPRHLLAVDWRPPERVDHIVVDDHEDAS